MIHIKKQGEPKQFTRYRRLPNACFDDMPKDVKDSLRNSLLEEQGYICAYCMNSISDRANTKIEHYVARNVANELDYKNLFAVCKGNEGSAQKALTCDSRKGNDTLHIDPQNVQDMDSIFYDSQGRIYSSNFQYQNDLNDILNLNYSFGYTMANRKAALDQLKEKIYNLSKKGDLKNYIDRLWLRYAKMKNTRKYEAYVGILRWYLEKKKKRFENGQ